MNKRATDDVDHRLITEFKAGSIEAMEKIIERYEDRIFCFGLKMCGHLQDAEDIAQETFLNAFKYLKDFREETQLKNWLFRLAATACIRKRRRKKSEPEHEISLDAFIPQNGRHTAYDIPDWSDDPADYMLRGELKKIIDGAIHSLSHKYRLVFNLRDMEGFSTQETAEILGITTQSVKTRLHRARLFLREKIATAYKEGGIS